MTKCDFCSAPTPKWRYPCLDFYVPEAGAMSVGDWAACDVCHDLIERGDREALLKRSVDTFPWLKVLVNDHPSRTRTEAEIGVYHSGFFSHRRGEAVPIFN